MATHPSPFSAQNNIAPTKIAMAQLTMDTSVAVPTATTAAGYVVGTGTELLLEELAAPAMAVRAQVGGSALSHLGEHSFLAAQPTITIAAADATNPRNDLVVINASGLMVVRTGTPAGGPVDPTLTGGDVLVGRVVVAALAASILDANIADLRQRRPIPGPKVKATAVDTEHLAVNSIDNSGVVANGAITAGKIASGGVSASAQLAVDVVDANALGPNSITAANGALADGCIDAAALFATGVVGNAAIASGAITAANTGLAAGAVIAGTIGVGGISASNQFAIDIVDAAAIASDAITAANNALANGCIDAAALFATGVVDYAALSNAVIKEATVTVTTGELLALNATPITIVAAPGAGFYVEFISATLWLDYNTAAYAGIGAGEDLVFKQNNAAGNQASAQVETTGFLDQASDQVRHVNAAATTATVGQYVPQDNTALVIHLLAGEVITGDSPLKVRCRYRINAYTW